MFRKPLVLTIQITIAIVMFGSSNTSAFDLPQVDPWYFQSTEAGYVFWVPDKAQHYYGSLLLTETFKKFSLPAQKVTAPALAFTVGFFWEVYQERQGMGFSERDLFADALGVFTSNVSLKSVIMWVDYSTNEQTIMLNVTKLFG